MSRQRSLDLNDLEGVYILKDIHDRKWLSWQPNRVAVNKEDIRIVQSGDVNSYEIRSAQSQRGQISVMCGHPSSPTHPAWLTSPSRTCCTPSAPNADLISSSSRLSSSMAMFLAASSSSMICMRLWGSMSASDGCRSSSWRRERIHERSL